MGGGEHSESDVGLLGFAGRRSGWIENNEAN